MIPETGESPRSGFESVVLDLQQTEQDASDREFTTRTIRFTSSEPTIKIGRSSKTVSKGLHPAADNAFFDSPVMSRSHAEIQADLENGTLNIKDTGSLHGTSVNGTMLAKGVACPLKSGDTLAFGIHVARGLEVFYPTTVKVEVVSNAARVEKTRAYSVPESADELSDCDCTSTDNHSDAESQHEDEDQHNGREEADSTLDKKPHSSSDSQQSAHQKLPLLYDPVSVPPKPAAETNVLRSRCSSVMSEDDHDFTASLHDYGEDESDADSEDLEAVEHDYTEEDVESRRSYISINSDEDSDSDSGAEEIPDDEVDVDQPNNNDVENIEASQDDGSGFLSTELSRFKELFDHAFGQSPILTEIESSANGLRTPPIVKGDASSSSAEASNDSDAQNSHSDHMEVDIAADSGDQKSENDSVPVTMTNKCNISSILNPSPPPSSPIEEASVNITSFEEATLDPAEAAYAYKALSREASEVDVGVKTFISLEDEGHTTPRVGGDTSNASTRFCSDSFATASASEDSTSKDSATRNPSVDFTSIENELKGMNRFGCLRSSATHLPVSSATTFLDCAPKDSFDEEMGEDEDNEVVTSATVFQLWKKKQAQKKRKADDMLASDDSVVMVAGPSESQPRDVDAPSAKRPATNAVVKSRKKAKSIAWAVAEKVGIAALGGAVVLGSLIYTAPTF